MASEVIAGDLPGLFAQRVDNPSPLSSDCTRTFDIGKDWTYVGDGPLMLCSAAQVDVFFGEACESSAPYFTGYCSSPRTFLHESQAWVRTNVPLAPVDVQRIRGGVPIPW